MKLEKQVLDEIYDHMDSGDKDLYQQALSQESEMVFYIDHLTILNVKFFAEIGSGLDTGIKVAVDSNEDIVSVDYYVHSSGADSFKKSVEKGSVFWRFAERAVSIHFASNGDFD